MMSTLLEGLDGVKVIMDDILVHDRNREEHDARLNAVLRIIKDPGLKLNPKKCVFRKTELTYFVHLIWGDGIKPELYWNCHVRTTLAN